MRLLLLLLLLLRPCIGPAAAVTGVPVPCTNPSWRVVSSCKLTCTACAAVLSCTACTAVHEMVTWGMGRRRLQYMCMLTWRYRTRTVAVVLPILRCTALTGCSCCTAPAVAAVVVPVRATVGTTASADCIAMVVMMICCYSCCCSSCSRRRRTDRATAGILLLLLPVSALERRGSSSSSSSSSMVAVAAGGATAGCSCGWRACYSIVGAAAAASADAQHFPAAVCSCRQDANVQGSRSVPASHIFLQGSRIRLLARAPLALLLLMICTGTVSCRTMHSCKLFPAGSTSTTQPSHLASGLSPSAACPPKLSRHQQHHHLL
jgi:hypothetical protein